MAQAGFSLNDLAPEDARLALAVERFVGRELGVDVRGGRLLVALSGGADSTALLTLVCALRGRLRLSVLAAHLDHGLRPESAQDARFALDLCRRFDVPCFVLREDVSQKARAWSCGLEEAGRRVRYAFLETCRKGAGADWTLTAHHAGDLAEDVLMRLCRGAGWPGLGGMRACDPARRVLRPLLMQEKDALTAMLRRLGIAWREDASNASRAWKRNRMRHDVLPLLTAENPAFLTGVRRLWRCARRDELAWERRLSGALRMVDDGWFVPQDAMDALGGDGRCRAAAEAVRRLGGQAGADTLERLEAAWLSRRFPRRFSFGGGVKAELSGRGLRVFCAAGR